MSTYAIVIRGDDNSLQIENKIINKLSNAGYIYDENNPETVFVVGGDGTFLKAIHQYIPLLNEIQFIGIHTGTLGFMCDYQIEDLDNLLELFLTEKPRIYQYQVLEVQLDNLAKTIYAFNEVRIENIINTITMDLWINDEYFEKFKGTGVCLCTQIGSTAVNRSLGGAVIQHGLPILELSEIAGVHHWKHRSLRSPLILKEDAVIHVKPDTFKNTFLCYDHVHMKLDECTGLTMKNSNYHVNIARYKQYSYLKRLKNVF